MPKERHNIIRRELALARYIETELAHTWYVLKSKKATETPVRN
jgi:hypothetical protein